MNLHHWSYSALRQYLECPLRFFFQRILAMPERSVSANLLLGSSVHAALAEYHGNLLRGDVTEAGNLHRIITDTWAEREEQGTVNYKDGETKDDGIA